MTINQQLLNKLKQIERLILEPTQLSPDEKKIKATDSPLIKAIKSRFKPETAEKETQTEITLAEIKQMEQDGGDLRSAIKQYIPLTTYKKETELRLQELDNTLKTYEQTQLYLKNEAKKDKELISELTKQAKDKGLTKEQLIIKIRELEKKLTKPLMVDMGTQTELTKVELAEMENTIKSLSDKLTIEEIVDKNSRGGKDILDRLEIIERGVASLEEDKKHNKTQRREMKKSSISLFNHYKTPPQTPLGINWGGSLFIF